MASAVYPMRLWTGLDGREPSVIRSQCGSGRVGRLITTNYAMSDWGIGGGGMLPIGK